jgi:hypothetical protein
LGIDNAQRELYEIRQGSKTAADFNLDFQRLALLANMKDNQTLIEFYKRGLNESLAREIWNRSITPPTTINEWYTQAVRRDSINRQANSMWPKRNFPPRNFPPRFPPQNNGYRRAINEVNMEQYDYPEPQYDYYPEESYPETIHEQEYDQDSYYEEDPDIQLNAVFTPIQKERYQSGKCIGCGALGHFVNNCPRRDSNLSKYPPKRNHPPQRFPRPPPRKPFYPNRDPPPRPPPGLPKISVLEIQNMIRNLPTDERMEFREAYITDTSLKPFGDF